MRRDGRDGGDAHGVEGDGELAGSAAGAQAHGYAARRRRLCSDAAGRAVQVGGSGRTKPTTHQTARCASAHLLAALHFPRYAATAIANVMQRLRKSRRMAASPPHSKWPLADRRHSGNLCGTLRFSSEHTHTQTHLHHCARTQRRRGVFYSLPLSTVPAARGPCALASRRSCTSWCLCPPRSGTVCPWP